MSNTYFKAMSVMGCEIGGITRRSLCRHNCCDGENCVTWLEKQFAKLNEYEEAKAEGRLVVLPCKVGDTVWYIPQYGGKPYCGVKEGHAQHITLSSRYWRIQVREHHPHNTDFVLGKTVFLTRAEAEEALKEEQHE
jgi:hypothetical protein